MTTLDLLITEFGGPAARLVDISPKYLGISPRKATDKATNGLIPLPVYRLGSQRSPWMVSLVDLADLIDRQHQAALTDWEAHQKAE